VLFGHSGKFQRMKISKVERGNMMRKRFRNY